MLSNDKQTIERLNELAKENEIYSMYDIYETGTILDDFLEKSTCVREANYVDSHRWFILQTDIYSYQGLFIGVTYIREHKSEMQCDQDVGITMKFSLYDRVPDYKYVKREMVN